MHKPRNSLSKGAIYQQLLALSRKDGQEQDSVGPMEDLPMFASTSMETMTTNLVRAGAICQLSRLYENGLVSAENFLRVVVDVATGDES
jgi:hypothetical protein